MKSLGRSFILFDLSQILDPITCYCNTWKLALLGKTHKLIQILVPHLVGKRFIFNENCKPKEENFFSLDSTRVFMTVTSFCQVPVTWIVTDRKGNQIEKKKPEDGEDNRERKRELKGNCRSCKNNNISFTFYNSKT